MPLAFLLSLATYLTIVAACFRWNNVFTLGLVNTLTLGVLLFAAMMAWMNRHTGRTFWFGFFLFFAASIVWYSWRATDQISFTLAPAVGRFIDAQVNNTDPEFPEVIYASRYYVHLAQCYLATAFGVIGGVLAMKTSNRER